MVSSPLRAIALTLAAALVVTPALMGCGDDDDDDLYGSPCRFEPDLCNGAPGALCNSNGDCGDGFCCTEAANCGGGMCTYSCDRDQDCPSDMGCEHDTCFFLCRGDADCADGQRCEHGGVCEWP